VSNVINLQARLPLGAGDYVSFSRTACHSVVIAHNSAGWREHKFSVPQAMYWADHYSQHDYTDVYIGNHSFNSHRDGRCADNVTELRGIFVDFDYYKTEHAHLNPDAFTQLVLDSNPWLPVPTAVVHSGRGVYFEWLFSKPLALNKKTAQWGYLQQWLTVQAFYVDSLVEFGADTACKDAARVFRLPETVNSKSNTKAHAWETGQCYEFKEIKRIANEQYKLTAPTRTLVPKTANKFKPSNVSKLFNYYSLAIARVNDIKRIATHRGGKFTDGRRMAIFAYSVESANYCRDEETLLNQVDSFIREYIAEPDNYLGNKVSIKAVVKRFNESQQQYGEDSTRYKLRTETLINYLNVTETEQRQLKTIISGTEKYRRKVNKRRANGVDVRGDYLTDKASKAANRRQQALELTEQGLSRKEVAEKLGVSTRTVISYLA
jgi:hypothetical protein